jgi:hypothetical protein
VVQQQGPPARQAVSIHSLSFQNLVFLFTPCYWMRDGD